MASASRGSSTPSSPLTLAAAFFIWTVAVLVKDQASSLRWENFRLRVQSEYRNKHHLVSLVHRASPAQSSAGSKVTFGMASTSSLSVTRPASLFFSFCFGVNLIVLSTSVSFGRYPSPNYGSSERPINRL